ncbi:unnamed protein product [Dibothriocephalus latus]|uniref:Reverse transcriptase domain-containing protein n=1 Tax=Dibothriocephalus latus TaxID=60516 RepID=A0A3P7N453_DIBLA|nr:unnamed protein product [Dibothriocephalus latus]
MIFAAQQLQEKCQEMRDHLYTTFVDLTKAFDTVNRPGLWKVMQKFGCPKHFTHMVRQLHDGMKARVTEYGTVSEAFAVTNGVKQGCVLAPTLFSLMCPAMLTDACRDERPAIRIKYRTDGYLLNSMICTLNTTTEADMQRSMDLFAAGCANFGPIINTEKTVVMHQPPPGTNPNALHTHVNGPVFKNVDNFVNLGSTLSRNTQIDDEVARRISKASQASRDKAVVLTTLVYGAETWTVYAGQARKLNHFHERIPNTEVLERTGVISIQAMLGQIQLRWSGHVVRMDDRRLPKRQLYGNVAVGARGKGGQKRRYQDTLKNSLKRLQINTVNREDLAQDRSAW